MSVADCSVHWAAIDSDDVARAQPPCYFLRPAGQRGVLALHGRTREILADRALHGRA